MKQVETLELSLDEAEEMRFEDSGLVEDGWAFPWKEVFNMIIDQRRWVTVRRKIIHRLDDDTFWEMIVETGSTEYQENPDPDTVLHRVYPHAVVTTVYKKYPPDHGAGDAAAT